MKKSLMFCIFFSITLLLSAQKDLQTILSEYVEDDTAILLIKEQKIETARYAEKDMSLKLTLKTPIDGRIKNIIQEDGFSPIFVMENLYLIKKETEKSKDISKILRSVSSFEGLQYYSHSRGSMRLLYKTSHAVEKTQTDSGKTVYNKIPDPLDMEADGLKILVRQEDLTFGNYIYEYSYFREGKSAGMLCTNTSVLKYSIFKVISPNNLKISLIIHDIGDYLLISACTQARFSKLPGIEKKLRNSFSSRAQAMYSWFIEQYKNAEDIN